MKNHFILFKVSKWIHGIRMPFVYVLLLLLFHSSAWSQPDEKKKEHTQASFLPAVLPAGHPDYIANQLLFEAALQSSLFQLPGSRNEWEQYRSTLKAEIVKRTGALLHQELPLNMRITGSIQRPGFSIKNIAFQTRPGIYATANLYVPDGNDKFPAVLVMMGHSPNGRFYKNYQAVANSLVTNGYICLCIDPWGAGERTTIHGIFEDHGDENNIGSSLLNIGETLMGLEMTDNIRAIDLLCSLPSADTEKIGATGSSGGGNQTMWLTALDERVKAAVSVVSAGTFESYILGSPCICEVLLGGLNLTEESGIIGMVAPRALKLINHTGDQNQAFQPKEMIRTCQSAKPVFEFMGAGENLSYKLFDLPHGYYREDREEMLAWFNKHLKGNGNGAPIVIPSSDTISCLDLMTYKPEKRDSSVLGIAAFCEKRGLELRNEFRSIPSFNPEMKRNELSVILGENKNSVLAQSFFYAEENGWKRIVLETSDGKILPVLLKKPPFRTDSLVLICSTAAMAETDSSLIADYLNSGKGVALVDLSGIGEAGSIRSHLNDKDGNFRTLARSELWFGRTMTGEWEKELEILVNFLRSAFEVHHIVLDASKETAIAALAMAAIHGPIEHVILRSAPLSYLYDTRRDPEYFSMAIHIPGFLKWGDLSLMSALSGTKIDFINPLSISGTAIPENLLINFQKEYKELRTKCGETGSVTFCLSNLHK
jgi:hypothetical protein